MLVLASVHGWYHEDAPDILEQYLASTSEAPLGSEASYQASLWQAKEGKMSLGMSYSFQLEQDVLILWRYTAKNDTCFILSRHRSKCTPDNRGSQRQVNRTLKPGIVFPAVFHAAGSLHMSHCGQYFIRLLLLSRAICVSP
jgi:hypothetical protein